VIAKVASPFTFDFEIWWNSSILLSALELAAAEPIHFLMSSSPNRSTASDRIPVVL